MTRYKAPSLLLAVGIVTLSAVGQSETPVTGTVQMMDFEEDTNTILGYPTEMPLGYFKRVEATQHLPATLPNSKYPPNPVRPCVGDAKSWNNIIAKTPEGPGRANALLSVLNRMGQHQCDVEMIWDSSTEPATIYTIKPVFPEE